MKKTIVMMFMLVGCGSPTTGSHAQGDLGGECYPNNTCNTGLLCENSVCVEGPDGGMPGSDAAKMDAPMPDAPPSCTPDTHEPNNTVFTATAVPLTRNMLTTLQASICPGTDQDWYSTVMPTGNSTLTVDLFYGSTGAAVMGGIYDANGVLIMALSSLGPTEVGGVASGLTSGTTYTVKIYGANVNPSYAITIKVSA